MEIQKVVKYVAYMNEHDCVREWLQNRPEKTKETYANKEWNLSWEELKLWFGWKTDVMAQRYARVSVEDLGCTHVTQAIIAQTALVDWIFTYQTCFRLLRIAY